MPAPRTILVTGATDGIGAALAQAFDAEGARLILTGRRPPADLDDPLYARHLYVAADLASPVDAAATIASALDAARVTGIDVLVHNAATGAYGDLIAGDPARTAATIAVNLEAPVALTRALLPRVLAAKGRIV